MSGANINYNQIVSFQLGLWMLGFVIDLSVPREANYRSQRKKLTTRRGKDLCVLSVNSEWCHRLLLMGLHYPRTKKLLLLTRS